MGYRRIIDELFRIVGEQSRSIDDEDSEKEREKFVMLNKTLNKIVCIKSRRESFSFHPVFAR